MSHRHAVVWLDHLRAIVVDFSVDHAHVVEVGSTEPQRQLRRKSGPQGPGHVADDRDFYRAIVTALGDAERILVVGPGLAKIAFTRFAADRFPALAERIVGIEAMDHPTQPELVAHARAYFRRVDQILGS